MKVSGGADKTPAIMIQGTASNSGKSLLCAALCRILHEEGFNPRPFKAQNMALNSCVTADGKEMGRAQAVQAAACMLEPDVRMNPVLLKPSSDTGSQVIVMGRPVGFMRVGEYIKYKPEAWLSVTKAYDSLAAEAGAMVLEGAGSPAEINLKADDIVNMAMARYAGASVLLAADIDRGGAFASIVGTMELLTPEERSLVAGFIINKFRGDAGLLEPALAFTSGRVGKPFIGIVPWIDDLGLPEEDSVSFKSMVSGGIRGKEPEGDYIDAAVIDFPHINNFTDLDPLAREPGLKLRVVRRKEDLARPDLLILPGSKNTPADLLWLMESGLARAVVDLARQPGGPAVIGICGGMQMLGKSIADPLGLEMKGEWPGLDLLDLRTELKNEKILSQVDAWHCLSGHVVRGYEIHHGETLPVGKNAEARIKTGEGRVLGWGGTGPTAGVWGTYAHGLFENRNFREFIIKELMSRKGIKPFLADEGGQWTLDAALGKLAGVVRKHVDMRAILKLLT